MTAAVLQFPEETRPIVRREAKDSPALCAYAVQISEASELVELGGRAGLISRVTGLEKRTVNQLYRQLRGAPSPPGLAPFTDAWFLEGDLRMLHASIVWRLHQIVPRARGNARALIDSYNCYRALVREPLLDLTHAAFVPSLVTLKLWKERYCRFCPVQYIAPIVNNDDECPACRLYRRHRCRSCGGPITVRRRGRKRRTCEACR